MQGDRIHHLLHGELARQSAERTTYDTIGNAGNLALDLQFQGVKARIGLAGRGKLHVISVVAELVHGYVPPVHAEGGFNFAETAGSNWCHTLKYIVEIESEKSLMNEIALIDSGCQGTKSGDNAFAYRDCSFTV